MRSVLCFSHSRNFGKKISLNKIPQGLCISVTSVLCNFLLQKSFSCSYKKTGLGQLQGNLSKCRGVNSATRLNKTSLSVSLLNNLASILEQKCLCRSCGTQHWTPRKLGGVSPTHIWDNTHTESWTPATDPAVACELAPDPLGCGLGAPGRHCLR